MLSVSFSVDIRDFHGRGLGEIRGRNTLACSTGRGACDPGSQEALARAASRSR